MISLPAWHRTAPIGVDIGVRSVKLVQLTHDRTQLLESARWDLNPATGEADSLEVRSTAVTQALSHARSGRRFRGRDAVLCLSHAQLFLQNVRVPKAPANELDRLVKQEAAARIPFPVAEAEIRFVEAAEVRQGDSIFHEILLFACHRPVLAAALQAIEEAGLRPVSVDIEPNAILRCYARQYRRDEDLRQRVIYVHMGHSKTAVIIAEGESPLFVKYIDVSGRQMTETVARQLDLSPAEAAALRRHNGERRSRKKDPEIARSIDKATRPVVERLLGELSMCIRYHSVTFRGRPLERLVLGGGEATEQLLATIGQRLDLSCELGNPLRTFGGNAASDRPGQWDVATGLALREVSPE